MWEIKTENNVKIMETGYHFSINSADKTRGQVNSE